MPETVTSLLGDSKKVAHKKRILPRFRGSLRTRVVGSILFIILFFGSLATLVVYKYARDSSRDLEMHDLEVLVQDKASDVERFLDVHSLVVRNLSERSEIISYLNSTDKTFQDAAILTILQNHGVKDYYSAVYLMDSEGLTYTSTDATFVGKNYSFRDYFSEAIKGQPFVTVARGVTSGQLGYYLSHPVIDKENNKTVGVAVIKLKPEQMDKRVFAGFLDTGYMLVDHFGVILNSDTKEDVYKSLGNFSSDDDRENISVRYPGIDIRALGYDTVLENMLSISSVGVFDLYDEVDEMGEFIAIAKVQNYPFYFILEEETAKINAVSSKLAGRLSLFVLSAAVSASVIIFVLVRKYLNPLKDIQEAATKVSTGDFSANLNEDASYAELSALAKSFNTMIRGIKLSRQEVDRKVEEQTKELHDQAAELEKQQHILLNVLEDVSQEKALSEQRAQELQKFRMAVENTSDHIVITDPDGIVLYANPALERITGFSKDEVLGKKAGSKGLWGGQMTSEVYAKFWEHIKVRKQPYSGEFTNIRKNGETYTAEAKVSPILDDKGEIIFFVGIERDITKAKEVDRMKTEFISLASHQLRTPLSAMKWFSEMLLAGDAGELNEEQHEYIDNIDQSNERMIALVDSLLDISRIESGRIIIDPKPTHLGELAKGVVNELKVKFEDKEITSVLSVHDNLPEINIDPKLIRNVYLNLLTNAIKYTPREGDINIFISKNDTDVVSQISDTGYGIPQEDQHKVFQKFFRSQNIVRIETDGTGLGLYLVKAIIESSGGKIWFESEVGKGTTFWFSLPLSGSQAKEGEVTLGS